MTRYEPPILGTEVILTEQFRVYQPGRRKGVRIVPGTRGRVVAFVAPYWSEVDFGPEIGRFLVAPNGFRVA